jgi:putative flippase GtrA
MSSDDQTVSARLAAITGRTQVRYLVVGGWNTLFGVALFAVLYWLLQDVLGYGLILLICQVIAVVQAHWAQRRFVWRSESRFWPELLRFSMVYVLAYFVNLGLLVLCVEVMEWPVLPSQLGVTILMVVLTYSINRAWTFRE